jgi:hypothetical protein
MRLILVLLLALPLASLAWAAGPEEGPADAVLLRAADSLVQVIASGCSGEEPSRAGSGFAIGKGGPFVTDLHVDHRGAGVARLETAVDPHNVRVERGIPSGLELGARLII